MGRAKRLTTVIVIFVGLILLSSATFTIDEKEQEERVKHLRGPRAAGR